MTNKELLALKALAAKAKPFTEEDASLEETEGVIARRRANAEFFLAAHPAMPELIDELLSLRQQQHSN